MRSELEETIQRELSAVIQPMRAYLDETTACNAATETGPDPGMMQSIEEHQKGPKGEAAVMPVGEPRKRRSVRNLAAERRQKMKERTRVKTGSRRKSAAPARMCPAVHKWHDEKRTSSGIFRPQKIVNRGRNWPSYAGRCPEVQKWYGARGT
jgi:hypothetical protein